MKKKYIALLYTIGIAVFVFLVWSFGFDKLIENIKITGWWFIPIIGIWIVVYVLNTMAFYVILGKNAKRIGFKRVLNVTISGFAINYITPFVTLGGEPYRILILKRYLDTKDAVASVTSFTLMHMLSHFILWIVTIPILFTVYFIRLTNLIWIIVAVFLFLSLLLYLLFSRSKKGIFTPLTNLLMKLPLGNKIKSKLENWSNSITEVDEKIQNFYRERKKDFYRSLTFEFVARVISSFEYFFALRAIGTEANFIDALLINSVLSLMLNILFFMPLQLGTREGSMYVVLKLLSLSSGKAIYVALVSRIRELFWIMIGLILMKFDMSGKRKFKSYIWQEDDDDIQKQKAQV